MTVPTITYSMRPDATTKAELAALAACYTLILDARTKKEGSRPGAPGDAKGPKHDRASEKYTRS